MTTVTLAGAVLHSPLERVSRVLIGILGTIALLGSAAALVAVYSYDGAPRTLPQARASLPRTADGLGFPSSDARATSSVDRYDHRANFARADVRLVGYRLAPNTGVRGADFVVDSRGTAIPTDAGRLRSGLERSGGFQDLSTNPATSRKFVGTDHGDPIRIRIEKGHPLDPAYTGPSDPLHRSDHLHVERRANGATGPWGEQWKIRYTWPF